MKMLLAPFIFLFVVGCSTLPLPNTDRQNLGAAEIVFTELVNQADALAVSGDLEGDALQTVQRAAAGGSAALDGAHAALEAGNGNDFAKWFSAVMAAVGELQRTLTATGDLT